MQRVSGAVIGLDSGSEQIFSDFDSDGEMWAGDGQRERMVEVLFSKSYQSPPVVHVSLKMLDAAQNTNLRYNIEINSISETGFVARFSTWGDTKIARASMNWMAIGALGDDEDDWTTDL